MLINTSPDSYLKQIFDQKTSQGFQYLYDYYQAQVVPNPVDKTNDEAPLLYNLFGTTDLPVSMIFSYNRLFNYINSLIGLNYKLHPSMTSQIDIVFVGFKFNKIYLNMILWLLNFQGINRKKFAGGTAYSKALEFVKEQFLVEFVNENIPAFIAELYKECEKLGILRTFKAPTVPLTNYENKGHEGISKRKQELLECLGDAEYASLFEKLDAVGLQTTTTANFKSMFIQSKTDHLFDTQLEIFIKSLGCGKKCMICNLLIINYLMEH